MHEQVFNQILFALTVPALASRGEVVDGWGETSETERIETTVREISIDEAAKIISASRGISYDDAVAEIGRLPLSTSLYQYSQKTYNGSVVFEAGVIAEVYNSGSFRQFNRINGTYSQAYDTKSGRLAYITYSPSYCISNLNSAIQVQVKASGVVQEIDTGNSNSYSVSLGFFSHTATSSTRYYTWTPNPVINFVWNLY